MPYSGKSQGNQQWDTASSNIRFTYVQNKPAPAHEMGILDTATWSLKTFRQCLRAEHSTGLDTGSVVVKKTGWLMPILKCIQLGR